MRQGDEVDVGEVCNDGGVIVFVSSNHSLKITINTVNFSDIVTIICREHFAIDPWLPLSKHHFIYAGKSTPTWLAWSTHHYLEIPALLG